MMSNYPRVQIIDMVTQHALATLVLSLVTLVGSAKLSQAQESIAQARVLENTVTVGRGPHDDATTQKSELPAPIRRFLVPLAGQNGSSNVKISNEDGLISLVARDAPLNEILSIVALTQGLNVVTAADATNRVSVTLNRVRLQDALTAIVSIGGYQWTEYNGIVHITKISAAANVPPEVQGRRIAVFQLDYVSGTEVNSAVEGMLSPIGQSYLMQSNPADNRQSRDAIVVEDLPGYIRRIGEYIGQVDQPPRQVLIEAYILEVELESDERWGVNFEHILNYTGSTATFFTRGFANPLAPQAFFTDIDGEKFNALLEWLQTTTDAKALATPKVLVVNGQTARIQIGDQLGYRVTTVTETSALESVDFLDVGVVLTVTPHISRDGHILMNVKPEVSTGVINPDTELPEEQTTEIQTDVLLRDGYGLVIGGLIQEKDSNVQSKIPYFGDLYYIGKLFQRRTLEKKRSEIIVAIMPHIVPYGHNYQSPDSPEIAGVQTRLFSGPLIHQPRPWEPSLADAKNNPISLHLPRPDDNYTAGIGKTYVPPASNEQGVMFEITDLPPVLELTGESSVTIISGADRTHDVSP